MNNNGSRVIAFLIGALAGGVAALLMAPQSGSETRRRIKEGAKDAYGKAGDQVTDVRDAAKEKIEKVTDSARSQTHAVKEAAAVAKDAYHQEMKKQREA
jgi:gas vesicle protein